MIFKRCEEDLVWVTLIVFMIDYPRICSTERPRFAATFSGEVISRKPLKVAFTTLAALVEP